MAKGTLTKTFDDLPKLVKIILALPFLDIVWMVYRLIRSLEHGNMVGVLLAVLLLIFGGILPWFWIVDLITIVVSDKVIWID